MAKKTYYDNSNEGKRFQPGTLARGEHVDGKFDQVQAGFEQAEQDIRRAVKLPFVPAMKSQEILANPTQRRYKMIGFDENGDLMLHLSAQEALDKALDLLDGLNEKLEQAWIDADKRDPNGVEVTATGTNDKRRLDDWTKQVLDNSDAASEAQNSADDAQTAADNAQSAADNAQSDVDDLAQNVGNIETTVNNIVNDTGELSATLDELEISTQNNADNISTLQNKVAVNTDSIDQLQDDVLANTENISTNTNAINALQNRTFTAGLGIEGGGDLSADRSFRLGLPSTLTGTTANARTDTSHTHAIKATAARNNTSDDALLLASAMNAHRTSSDHDERYYTKSEVDTAIADVEASGDTSGLQSDVDSNTAAIEALESRTITAGLGIEGGGDLSADRSFRLGLPSTLTGTTANARTDTSHTHAIKATAARNNTSDDTLLLASAMNAHRTSNDHDERYYTKSEVDAIAGDAGLSEVETQGAIVGNGTAASPVRIHLTRLIDELYEPTQSVFYVSGSLGSDSNSGTSSSPLKTILEARSRMESPVGRYTIYLRCNETYTVGDSWDFGDRRIRFDWYDDPVYKRGTSACPLYLPTFGEELNRPLLKGVNRNVNGSPRYSHILADELMFTGIKLQANFVDSRNGQGLDSFLVAGKIEVRGCMLENLRSNGLLLRAESILFFMSRPSSIASDRNIVSTADSPSLRDGGQPVEGTCSGEPSFTPIGIHEIRNTTLTHLIRNPAHNTSTGVQFNFRTSWNPY